MLIEFFQFNYRSIYTNTYVSDVNKKITKCLMPFYLILFRRMLILKYLVWLVSDMKLWILPDEQPCEMTDFKGIDNKAYIFPCRISRPKGRPLGFNPTHLTCQNSLLLATQSVVFANLTRKWQEPPIVSRFNSRIYNTSDCLGFLLLFLGIKAFFLCKRKFFYVTKVTEKALQLKDFLRHLSLDKKKCWCLCDSH